LVVVGVPPPAAGLEAAGQLAGVRLHIHLPAMRQGLDAIAESLDELLQRRIG
jgi:hypothetical protein